MSAADMQDLRQQLEELTNVVIDEREMRERLQADLEAERDATARLASDLRETIYQVADPLNAALAKKVGLKEVQELLASQDGQLQKLQQNAKENASAMRVLMETVEDTMPIEDTHRLLKELEEKTGEQLLGQMEEIAVELSDSEERLRQQLSNTEQQLGQRLQPLEQAPWAADVAKLEGRLLQVEQSQLDASELTHTFSSRLESGLGELDREIKSVADELSRAVAEAADVRRAALTESGKLSEGIGALDAKLDQTTMQLAARIDDRAQTLDSETADLAAQVDATLEKVYGRMDGFTAEVQQFVSQQDGKWSSTAETTTEIHAALASLRGETEALGVRAAHAEAAAAQTTENVTALQDRQLSKLEQRVEKVHIDSENATSGLKATLERVQRQAMDSAERIDAVNATVGSLGTDISACGKDIAQSIDDTLLCRQELQQATQRFDGRMVGLGDEVHALDASLASRLARYEARAETISADAERGEARNAELAAALQDAFDKHVDTADQRAADVTSRLQAIENDSQVSQQQWIASFEALEKQQSNSTDALTRKTDDLGATLEQSLDDIRAELERHIRESWSEQADRLASSSTQLRDALSGVQGTLERQIADTDAAQRSSVERLSADCSSRIDAVRDSLEDQLTRSGTEARAARAKLESDLGLLVDRSVGSLEQQLHERSSAHDTKLSKSSSELSTLIQTVRAELERYVSDRLSAQEARVKKSELDAQENLEKQQLEMTRLQGDVNQSVAKAADTAKHELTTYIAAQERAAKDTSIATSNAIEDASSTLEARISERMRTSETRLVEAVSGMSDDLQKTRADLDGAMRERMASLDSGMRALETAIRSEVDSARNELRTQVNELGTEQDTKLSRSEADLGDRLGTVEDDFKTQLENLNAGLKRQMEEGLADAESTYTKIRSDLTLELDNKCSALQREREQGDTQISTTLASHIDSVQLSLTQAIATTEKTLEQRCTSIHESADQSLSTTKEQLEATMAQQVAQLAGQSAQLEADVGKLVEETCAALDEHWSGRMSEQVQRIADFESAIVKNSDASAAGLKQQFNQVAAEQNTQLRHLVSQANDLDLKIEDLKTSVEGEWANMEEKRQAAAVKSEEMESLLGKLESGMQTTVLETLGGLNAQMIENETEHDARLGELEGLVNKVTAHHATTAQNVEETQTKLSQLYTDMAELVQTAQLTIEEQMNASVAMQDRRMGEAEQVAEAVAARVSQCEAAGANFDSSLGRITVTLGNVSAECAQQVAQSVSQTDHRLGELEALANANLAHVTEQAQQLQQLSVDMSTDIDHRNEALANRVAASHDSLAELQAVCAQTETRLRDVESQLNLSVATTTQQHGELVAAQNGLNEQVSVNRAALQATEGSINRNVAAMDEIKSNLGAVTEEIMQTIDSATKHLQDTTSNVAVDAAARHSSVVEQLNAMQRSVEEATARMGEAEAAINISSEKAAETSQTIESLRKAIDGASDLSRAQLEATAQATETRVLGVESRLENLATVLGQEVQGAVGSMREEVEGLLNPYDGRMTELEAAVNTGVVRMANSEARIEEVSAASTQANQETKAQLDDVDKVLEAESSNVSAQLREAQRHADAAATELRGFVEERAQAAVAAQKEAVARLQAELADVRTRTVPELGRQQASTDVQLKKLQSEVWQGALTGKSASSSFPSASAASSSSPEEAGRLGQLEQRTETLKGTVGKALEMLGRLRSEHGARLDRLEATAPGTSPGGSSGGSSSSSSALASSRVPEGVPGIPAEQLRRIADEFGRRSGAGDRLTFVQAEQSIHALGFACGSSYLAEVWRKYDQGRGSVDFPTFCAMWLFVTEGLER
jgi:chromosome segregation ATPase